MHPYRPIVLAVLVAALAGCSTGEPFVDRNNLQPGLRKQKLPGYAGSVTICHGSDTPRADIDRMADDACSVYGLTAMRTFDQRWNCRFFVPHTSYYVCYDPTMRMDNGPYINPFNRSQVEQWMRNQERRKAGTPADGDPAAGEDPAR